MSAGAIRRLAQEHLRQLHARQAVREHESPEALLADLLPWLIRGTAHALGRSNVDLLGQAYERALGRPDFSVRAGALLVGHLETKPPGTGADVRRFRGHDREQWQRFSKLPNVVYSDGLQFALYRSGERAGSVVDLEGVEESDAARQFAELVADFLSWRAVAPRNLPELAERLAPLCSLLRDAVSDQLARRNSEVATAAREVEDALFAGRPADEVADAFAQVCTYTMLLARSRGARRLDAGEVERTLRHAHPVLGRVVRLLVDEATEAELGWALDTVRALVEAVEFPALEAQAGEDAWLYFYETFLARYDPRLRDEYGVYYTPAPVISAQVALVDELIRERFERADGLAADGVTVLDPAVGTGSYLLRVIAAAARRAEATHGPGAVPGVIGGLAANLFAFEVLVGPYAVAHLRINEQITQVGGSPPSDGVHVYLTDTLDNPYAEPLDLGRQLEPLVAERRRALRVKGRQDILVCLGNPPYERLAGVDEAGEARGGWVVHGEGGGSPTRIFDRFLDPARRHTMFSHIASLYNLYVYFWRWALWKVFEAPSVDGASNGRPGVVSFISASSYLTGPGFLGMREHLRRLCDELWVIDLGGEGHGARREDNVFAIQTPVAICLAVRTGEGDPDTPAAVHYARLRGDREAKLGRLAAITSFSDLEWHEAGDGWHEPLRPRASQRWLDHPALSELFPFQAPGAKIGRTWPIAPTAEAALERWRALAGAPRDARAELFAEARHGRRASTRPSGGDPAPASMEPITEIDAASPEPPIVRYGYRSFDRQWIVADIRLMRTPSQRLWRAHSDAQIYLVSLLTDVLGNGPAATVTACVPDLDHFRGSFGGRHVIPLYRDASGTPNVAPGAVAALGSALGRPIAAEDLFAYAYALLACRGYTERFWDELETPGARLPVTRDPARFARAVELGETLINLHTYGRRLPELGRGVNPGSARLAAPIGPGMPEDFSYDADGHRLLVGPGIVAPVDPEVWDYKISGLAPLRSWLHYRMREPAGRAKHSRSRLDRIRPTAWTRRLDDELLELLWTLERTIALEPRLRELLDAICDGATVDAQDLGVREATSAGPA